MGSALEDRFGRRFSYLRLSVTDACNFRCEYCLPHGYQGGHKDFLTLDEIRRLLSAFAELGIRKVRITGGEPLVRKDILEIVQLTADTPGIERVAMTTNAFRFAAMAEDFQRAGLDAVNISLDTLDPGTFEKITGTKRHAGVIEAIDTALALGYDAIKLNAVLLAGLNDQEIPAFMEYVRTRPVSVRFIELMQTLGNEEYFHKRHARGAAIAEHLLQDGWRELPRVGYAGPAIEYYHPDYAGRIGLIQPYSPNFCDGCNRLRVTSVGGLRLCLFGTGSHELRPLLQADEDREALKHEIVSALFDKAPSHQLGAGNCGDIPNLAATGG